MRESPSLDLRIADIHVSIAAPLDLLTVLRQMMVHVPRDWNGARRLDFSAIRLVEHWKVSASASGNCKFLQTSTPMPDVAGAVVSSVLHDVGESIGAVVLRACVVERNGRALAFTGGDWESNITIAAHLQTRGWRFVGTDYAMIERATLNVIPFAKLLFVSSSCISSFPRAYRSAIEASPWYSSGDDIAFYAVDPRVLSERAWSPGGRLADVIVSDGISGHRPSLDLISDGLLGDGAFTVRSLRERGVAVAQLKLGPVVATCDLIETSLGPAA